MRTDVKLVVMGVCACGKSTIGSMLAEQLSVPFEDGDIHHPETNIKKMEAGIALDDEDRWPWLEKIGNRFEENQSLVIACSALKKSYRDRIQSLAGNAVTFVHLSGSRALLVERMKLRTGHFMPLSLLDSQLKTLDHPGKNERAVTVDIDAPVKEIINSIIGELKNHAFLS